MKALSLEQVLDCPRLPSLPTIAVQLLDLTRDENVRLREIGRLVQHDPALTAKILRTVNSPYYGLSKPCPTILRAITYLGLDTVKSLVLSFSLVDLTKQAEDGFDLVDFWRRALYSAAVVRRITTLSGMCDPDEAFAAALMQDIGMIALHAAAPTPYRFILAQTARDHHRLPAVERNAFGIDHAEVGAALGRRWRLPSEMVAAIRHHHDLQQTQHIELVCALALAYEITAAVTLIELSSAPDRVERLAFQWFGFSLKKVKELTAAAIDDAGELSALLRVDIGSPPNTNEILSQAEEAFIRHQVGIRRETETVGDETEDRTVLATTDPLTQVGNRNCFNEALTGALEAARTSGGSVGLIIVDADRFKIINDTFGHDVGDALLVELAARLRRTKRDGDVLCRLGGEEFGLVVPSAAVREVAVLAESLRVAVCARPFEVTTATGSGESLKVTVSVGVVVFDARANSTTSSPELLVKAADKALRAAKEAGRNQVRVFRSDSGLAAA